MARRKIKDEHLLKTWEEVDLTLKEIAEYEMEIEKIQADMNQNIHDVKLDAEMKAKPLQDKIEMLGLYVKDFVEENKAELNGKTKTLNFGKTGFRLSTKLVIRKAESILENLKRFKMQDCINTKETINKDVLKKYSEEDIIKVGASLKKEDVFWYETEREELQAAN
ncbi:host-nuclease inhibitor Gam family protein [Clostridium amazonitimonense]|uniref:host-nuclease inhibitor Gam family protein n=1 Tax=Clostridium amazonitimonense TaxID=1499689 RepID=UPI000509D47F|nr:host-nuclease inhibitor Gam family protein [Clostridium amazonitimonense]